MQRSHQRYDQPRPDVTEIEGPITLLLTIALFVVVHLQKPRDLTSVISKNDTTNGDKCSQGQ